MAFAFNRFTPGRLTSMRDYLFSFPSVGMILGKLLLKKDERADTFVKIYLSYFSLCRAIRLAKRVDRSILKKSLVSPFKDVDRVENAISQFICHVPKWLHRYWKHALTIPMYQGIT